MKIGKFIYGFFLDFFRFQFTQNHDHRLKAKLIVIHALQIQNIQFWPVEHILLNILAISVP